MKLFISYSRDDKAWARELWYALRDEMDHDVWIDQRLLPAQDWWQTILDSIEDCGCFIYVMTPKSIESIYCRAELDYALALKKPILPLMLKPSTPPSILSERNVQYLSIDDMSIHRVLIRTGLGLTAIQVKLAEEGPKPPPMPVARPNVPKPDQKPEQISEVFARAQEAVVDNHLIMAEILLQQVVEADPNGLGRKAVEWLSKIRFERENVVHLAKEPTLGKLIVISHRLQPGPDLLLSMIQDPLEALGYQIFRETDSTNPKDSSRVFVEEKIINCDCFLIVVRDAETLEAARDEILVALRHKKLIIPVTVNDLVWDQVIPATFLELRGISSLAFSTDEVAGRVFLDRLITTIERGVEPRINSDTYRKRLEELLLERYHRETAFSVVEFEEGEKSRFYRRTAEVFEEEIRTMLSTNLQRDISVGLVCGVTLREIVQYWWENRPTLDHDSRTRLRFVSLNRAGLRERYQFSGNYLAVSLSELFRGARHKVDLVEPDKPPSTSTNEKIPRIDVLFCSAGGRDDGILVDWLGDQGIQFPASIIGDFCLWPIDVNGNVVLDPPDLREAISQLALQPMFQQLSDVGEQRLCSSVIFPIASQPRYVNTSSHVLAKTQTDKVTITRVILESGIVTHCILDELLAESLLWNTNSDLCGYRLISVQEETPTEVTYRALKQDTQRMEDVRIIRSAQEVVKPSLSNVGSGYSNVHEIVVSDAPQEVALNVNQRSSFPIHIDQGIYDLVLEPHVRKPGYWSMMTVRTVERLISDTKNREQLRLWDMGCGSGVVGLLLGHHKKIGYIFFSDIAEEAVHCTQENVKSLNSRQFDFSTLEGDLFSSAHKLPQQKFDLIVFAPPFFPEYMKSKGVLEADIGGEHGYELAIRFAEGVGDYLTKGGCCVVTLADYIGYNEVERKLQESRLTGVHVEQRDVLYPYEPRYGFPQCNEIIWRNELEQFCGYNFQEYRFDNRRFIGFKMVHLIAYQR